MTTSGSLESKVRRHILNSGGGFADKTYLKMKPTPVCEISFTCGGVKASVIVVDWRRRSIPRRRYLVATTTGLEIVHPP